MAVRTTLERNWTFLTNHSHVLVCILRDPHCTVREMALAVGITERATLRIIADLELAGFLVREREGRRNVYRIRLNGELRHPVVSAVTAKELLEQFKAK